MFHFVSPGSSYSTLNKGFVVKTVKSNKILAIMMLILMMMQVVMISGGPITIQSTNKAETVTALSISADVAHVNYSILTNNLLNSAFSNYARINATLTSLVDINISAQIREQIQDAVRVLKKAEEENDEGNYSESARLAHDAVNRFGESLKNLFDLTIDPTTPNAGEIIEGLKGALERAVIYLDRLNTSALRLQEEGYDISGIPELLTLARNSLNTAREHLTNGDHNEAGGALGSAKELLDKANTHLNSIIQMHKERKVEQYVNQFSSRITEINNTITAVSSKVQLSNTNSVQASLNNAQQNLDIIKSNIQEGVSFSLRSLTESVDDIKNTLNELNGNGTGTKISEMNRILANVQVMKNTAVSRTNRGLNTTAVNIQINRTEQIIEEMRKKFADGSLDEIDDLIEDAMKKYFGADGSLSSNEGNKIIDRVKKGIEDALSKYGNSSSLISSGKRP